MQLRSVLGLGWLMFIAYWWISAVGVKKNIRPRSWRREIGVRVLVIGVIIVVTSLPATRSIFQGGPPSADINSVRGVAGLTVSMAGFALAVWARRHLGRNWGMPMTLKEGHELVTTGPYRYVRHPIYTGMLLAIVGSGFVNGPIWVLVFIGMAVYCAYSARTEEGIMLRQFPEQYARYQRETKAIIPFLF